MLKGALGLHRPCPPPPCIHCTHPHSVYTTSITKHCNTTFQHLHLNTAILTEVWQTFNLKYMYMMWFFTVNHAKSMNDHKVFSMEGKQENIKDNLIKRKNSAQFNSCKYLNDDNLALDLINNF